MKDGGCRRRYLRMIENLNRNLHVKKDEYETKCTSTIELLLETTRVIDLSNIYYCVLMTFTYSWFCFQIEKRRYGRDL